MILDRIDPPREKILAPCPECGNDVSKNYQRTQARKDDLIFYLCYCGHASAWFWDGSNPQLIYGDRPGLEVEE